LQIPSQYKSLASKATNDAREGHAKLIDELIACDDFEDIATLKVIIMTKNAYKLQYVFSHTERYSFFVEHWRAFKL